MHVCDAGVQSGKGLKKPPNSRAACTVLRALTTYVLLPLQLLQVYKVAKVWEGLPTAEQLAQLSERLRLQRHKRRVREEAAAAGAPVPDAAPPAAAAAAANDAVDGDIGGEDDDIEVVEVTAELGAEQVLRLRREAAARAGMLIDLSREAPEDELEAANR
jgi:hypothetical protein